MRAMTVDAGARTGARSAFGDRLLLAETPEECAQAGIDWLATHTNAADLLVGKPGGLTSSEARAAGLPLVAIHPIPGQEERNLAHLIEWGAAIACHTPATLGWRVRSLLDDAERLQRMRMQARASSRPDAASEVAQAVLAMVMDAMPARSAAAAAPRDAMH